MKRIEDILALCLDDIQAGRATLTDCLARYPDQRAEMEPLLRVALSIGPAPAVAPSPAFRARAKVELTEQIYAAETARPAHAQRLSFEISRAWQAGWLKTVAVITAMAIVFGLGGGGVYASQGSLPGDILYPVKMDIEEIQRTFIFDDASATALELRFAATRLDELKLVAATRPDQMAVAASGYQANLAQATLRAGKAAADSEIALEMVAGDLLGNLHKLEQIEDTAPGARDIAAGLKETVVGSHISITGTLAKSSPVKAAELNLAAIEDRLDRAKSETAKGNRAAAENALREFELLRETGKAIYRSSAEVKLPQEKIDEINDRVAESYQQAQTSLDKEKDSQGNEQAKTIDDIKTDDPEQSSKVEQPGNTQDVKDSPAPKEKQENSGGGKEADGGGGKDGGSGSGKDADGGGKNSGGGGKDGSGGGKDGSSGGKDEGGGKDSSGNGKDKGGGSGGKDGDGGKDGGDGGKDAGGGGKKDHK